MLRKRHASAKRRRRHRDYDRDDVDEPWSMLHFDAHPDLACPHPTIPASACYQPRKKWRRRPVPTSQKRTRESPEEKNNNNNNSVMLKQPDKEEDTDILIEEEEEDDENGDGKNLYEFLDSTATGIAEWILPLVLAANLRRVDWVRPVLSSKTGSPRGIEAFPLGEHVYQVGAWIAPENELVATNSDSNGLVSSQHLLVTSFLDLPPSAVVKVDYDCAYYTLDDVNCVAPPRELLLAQSLHLSVSELVVCDEEKSSLKTDTANSGDCGISSEVIGNENDNHVSTNHLAETETAIPLSYSSPWILDICLDYFACQNPFLIELERISPAVSTALTSCVHHSLFYNHQRIRNVGDNKMDGEWCQCPLNKDRDELSRYRALLSELISLAAESKAKEQHGTIDRRTSDSAVQQKSETFTMTAGGLRASELLDSLTGYYCQHQPSRALLQSLVDALTTAVACLTGDGQSKLIQLAVEAIPNVSMPHDPAFSTAAKEGVLPDDILYALERVRLELTKERAMVSKHDGHKANRTYGYKNDPPFMVTVCRSADDGFTPVVMVDELQTRILSMVHDCYCSCKTMDNCSSFSQPTTTCNDSNVTKDIATAASKPRDHEAALASSECRLDIVFDYGPWEGSSIEL